MSAFDTRKTDTGEYSDILEALRFELGFLEQGGYGRSVHTPRKSTSVFQDSPACLNFNDPNPTHPCAECFLINFVSPEHRHERVPCHHIRLNEAGGTLKSIGQRDNQAELEEAVKDWLRTTIKRLEKNTVG